MGTNIGYDKLIASRNEIMDQILADIQTWNGDMESGINLVENNRIKIDQIKNINKEIDGMHRSTVHDDAYREKLNALYMEQKNLFKILENKQRELMDEKQQLNKKDQVVKNYISKKNAPIFIDKDIT